MEKTPHTLSLSTHTHTNTSTHTNPHTTHLVWLCGTPGASPKCLTASRALRGPWRRMVFWPSGALRASWSKVSTSPPALRIRARAPSVNLRAHTWGIVNEGGYYCAIVKHQHTRGMCALSRETNVCVWARKTYGQFWNVVYSNIIGNCSHDYSDLGSSIGWLHLSNLHKTYIAYLSTKKK